MFLLVEQSRMVRLLFWLAIFWLAFMAPCSVFAEQVTFLIRGYDIENNKLLPDGDLQELLWPYIGNRKTTVDVEQARGEIEKYFHQQGYVRVMVNIPEQSIEDGVVRLEVVKNKIGRVRVSGNRYYTRDMILRELPSLQPGQVMYLPDMNADLGRLGRNPNIKMKVGLSPGRKANEDVVELKVEDQLPLHGKVELNNYASHDTTALRASAMLRYDNLWQKNHSVSAQYQTSPENTDEVQVLAGTYVVPASWDSAQLFVLYGVWSDSQTAISGSGMQVVGKGNIFGLRYLRPLPAYRSYSHNLTLGIDYKNFEETVAYGDTADSDPEYTPMEYLPFSLSYGSSLKGETGLTLFSLGFNGTIRGIGSEYEDFANKRYRARSNYLYVTAHAERQQQLPLEFRLDVKMKAQYASQPLIANEQFSVGGSSNLHGYKESESFGDNAFYASVKLGGPDLMKMYGVSDGYTAKPSLIFEHVSMEIKDPLIGQEAFFSLNGLGATMEGTLTKSVAYKLDWGMALSDSNKTEAGTHRSYFSLAYQF